jgi:hypothetical protein
MINEDVFERAKWMYKRSSGNRMLQARLARWAAPKAQDVKSLAEAIENLRTETSFLLDEGFEETFSGKSTIRFSDCQKRSTSIYTVTPDDGDKRSLRAVMGAAQTALLTPGARITTLMPIDEY